MVARRRRLPSHPEEGNVGRVCDKHKPKPDPRFLSIPPEDFLGLYCKLRFESPDGKGEYMWVLVVDLAQMNEDEELRGVLCNTPVVIDSIAMGDMVEFSRKEICGVTDESG